MIFLFNLLKLATAFVFAYAVASIELTKNNKPIK